MLYLPALWQIGDDYIHSAQAPSLSLLHEIALLNFHIVEFQGKPYAAATFRATQLFEGEQTVTEETYLKGVGLYRTDDFILESVEGRAIGSGNSPAQKKKKGGALGWEWLLLALLIAPTRLRGRRKLETEVR